MNPLAKEHVLIVVVLYKLFYINSGRYTKILSRENVGDVLLYSHDRRIIQGTMTDQMHLVTKLSSKMNDVALCRIVKRRVVKRRAVKRGKR